MKRVLTFLCLCIFVQLLVAQEFTLTGVIAASDDPLPITGANISIKGSAVGTISDLDGQFQVSAKKGDVLVISFIGYKTQEIQISSNAPLKVTLEPDNLMLDEVVAIGYGSMKKSDLTGAVTSVKADQLQKTPASGLDQALQGRAAGVTVNANSGQPGAAAEVRIRGIGSVVGDSSPIYVVDGMITSDISFLSPSDIQSTEVLKDASATAIYGSRGANGVILVTTKSGSKGKANISLGAYWGVQSRWRKLDLMNSRSMAETRMRIAGTADELATYQQQGFNEWMSYNVGSSPYFPLVKSAASPNGFDYSAVETDWQDEVFRNALIQNYNVSIEGGNDDGQYAFSANYFTQEGTIIGSDYERLTLRFNSEYKVRKWLKIGEHLSFMNSTGRNAMNNHSSPGASIISAALAMAPWDPTHYANGSVNNAGKNLSGQISASSNFKNVTNPFSMVEHNNPMDKTERWVGDLYAEITPFKGLTLRSSISLDLANVSNRQFRDAYEYSTYDRSTMNYLSSSMSRYSTLMSENILTYSNTIGQHSFSAMAGQTVEEYNYYTVGGAGSNILNPEESNWYLSQTTTDRTYANDAADRTRRFSMLGRLHYSYASKYLVTLNFRADASSKFPNNPWGYFPSTALAWRVSEEDWMRGISNLDNLKLRAGWGRVGNDKVASGSFLQTMYNQGPTFVGYPMGQVPVIMPGATVLTYADADGKWETNEQWNVGVDFGLFAGLLNGSVDWFLRDTKDALLYVSAPAHVGNRYRLLSNIGNLRNSGVEITLDHRYKVGKDFTYSLGANVSFIRHKLTKLNGGSPLWGDRTVSNEGLPLRTFWGYEYEGVYKTNQEALTQLHQFNANTIAVHAGDARYKDQNGDGVIDDEDRVNLGNPFPWLTYGFNVGAEYKNFDLQLFFQGVYGNKIYNALRERTEGSGTESTLSSSMSDVWIDYSAGQKAAMESFGVNWMNLINTNGSIPNPNGATTNTANSSRFVESGAYLRLKNIQLGYTLPRSITDKAKLGACRFYVSGNNLLTFTNYTGYDPEVNGGVDYGNYPQSRTFTFGFTLGL